MTSKQTPQQIALDLIEDLKDILSDAQLTSADIEAYRALQTRIDNQPENVRWLFAYELQYLLSHMVENFRSEYAAADPAAQAMMRMDIPEDVTILKSGATFIEKTLGIDTSYRVRYLSSAFKKLNDRDLKNPYKLEKIYNSVHCPRHFNSRLSAPKQDR